MLRLSEKQQLHRVFLPLHLDLSVMQREQEYCNAVFRLLVSGPERSTDLATLGRHISKPSKKACSRSILAADPRFIVTGTVVTLADDNPEHYDDSDEDARQPSTSDASRSNLRPIGRLPPSEERAYKAKFDAAKRLPSCTLPPPQQLRQWPHACIGPAGCPPLFPGPPLWLSDLAALSAVLPPRAAAGLKFAAQVYATPPFLQYVVVTFGQVRGPSADRRGVSVSAQSLV